MKPLRHLLVILSLPLVLLVVVGTLRARVAEPSEAEVDRTMRDLQVFAETLELVQRFYVEDVELGQLERGAFQGLAESLDPWSSYWDPERMGPLLARDRRGDIGVLLMKPAQQYVRIVAVVPGSPADDEGLRPGQYVETLDGLETKDLTLLEARAMLEGPPGSTVELGFFRERDDAEHPKMTLTREDLAPLDVVVEREGEDAAVVRVTRLVAGTSDRVAAALEQLVQEGVERLVLDLRVNLGGEDEEARAIADLFVRPGPVFRVRDRDGVTVHAALAEPKWTGPMAVLTGSSTVGEAELLAAALKERDDTTVVGSKTFGKRDAQDLVILSDGAGLLMTVADYLDASGEPFAKGGIEPDETVRRSPASEVGPADDADETDGAGGDPAPAADSEADEDDGGSETAEPAAADGEEGEEGEDDPVLERALEILRGEAAPAGSTAAAGSEPA